MAKVCVIGSSNLDFTVAVPRLPAPGETVSGGTLMTSPGGKGANQAVAARRLGAEVRFVTLIGSDPPGERLGATLEAEGLPPEGILRTALAPTGVALIAVDAAGRNQIAVAPGANHHLGVDLVAPQAGAAIAWADVVLLQLETPVETVRWALAEARRSGRRAILNPAPARVLPLPPDLPGLADYLTPNEGEAGLLAGREVRGIEDAGAAAEALLAAGAGTIVVTLGAEGALVASRAGRVRVPSFQVGVVDSVGAGDAFNGALATLLAAGAPIVEATRVAAAAGALACTRRGAVEALPRRDEVLALLESAGWRPSVRW